MAMRPQHFSRKLVNKTVILKVRALHESVEEVVQIDSCNCSKPLNNDDKPIDFFDMKKSSQCATTSNNQHLLDFRIFRGSKEQPFPLWNRPVPVYQHQDKDIETSTIFKTSCVKDDEKEQFQTFKIIVEKQIRMTLQIAVPERELPYIDENLLCIYVVATSANAVMEATKALQLLGKQNTYALSCKTERFPGFYCLNPDLLNTQVFDATDPVSQFQCLRKPICRVFLKLKE